MLNQFSAERTVILNEFHDLSMAYANAINEETEADAFIILEAKREFYKKHSITNDEYRAFKSRYAIKCSNVEQAIAALKRAFSPKQGVKA
ncbi:hypothetical protein [Rheinheimera sp. MMS21-TC3]|uniref:hypothetical protein n=1 Tax=Rheinheimera sp. MMS21-TC3 TaxID=3072790 RepID=UPI0028C3D459|nr:hypothetical protein [Rheinheimera sp. MMS21-TC3]WNO60415.1 hypothetical protein RDV63_05470 [Rheinheimera sp. MMS21-TC3]